MRLTNQEYKILKKVEDITGTNYEINEDKDIDINSLLNVIDELLSEYQYIVDKLNDYTQYVEDNYKAITKEEQIYG